MNKKTSIIIILLLTLSCFLPLTVNAQIIGSGSIDNSLLVYWRLDDNTGTSATDSSGNSNAGTFTGTSTWVTGKFNSGMYAPSTSHINNAKNLVALGITNNFTISTWVKLNDTSNSAGIFTDYSSSNGCTLRIDTPFNQVTFYVYPNNYRVTATYAFSQGVWYNVVGVANTTGLAVYVNGAYVNSAALGGNVGSGLATAELCASATYDDFRIYRRALSTSEISVLYTGYYVSVTHDTGSIVTPDDIVSVGVDQSKSFIITALDGFSSWTQYIDGVAYAPQAVITFSGVQSNHTLYATSQWIGGVTPTPTTTNDMAFSTMFIVGLLAFLIVLNIILLGLGSMIVRFLVALFTLVMAGIAITVADIPLAPYFQMFTVVISLLCMFLAAKAKG